MSEYEDLRAEFDRLVADPPPVADRVHAVHRRIQRTRARRLAVVSAGAVCAVVLAVAFASHISGPRQDIAGAELTTSVPSGDKAPVSVTKDGITLSIDVRIDRGYVGGMTKVVYVVTVHGDGKPVCGSTISVSTHGNYMDYCGQGDDTTFTIMPMATYPPGRPMDVTATFSRSPDGQIPPTGPGVPQAPKLLVLTADFTT